MRPLGLLLAAAASALAGEPDINAPGFWFKTYTIPSSYCERRIAFETDDEDRIIKASRPCPLHKYGEGLQADCMLPREDADRIAATLKTFDGLTAYSQMCEDAPEYPELYFKRDFLRREWGELDLSSAAAPGITNLLEAQFAALDSIIGLHEEAMATRLSIQVTARGRKAPTAGVSPLPPRRRPNSAKLMRGAGAPPSFWGRRNRPACDQIEVLTVTFEGSPKEKLITLKAIEQLGDSYADSSCPALANRRLGGKYFIELSAVELRKRLTSMSGFREWNVGRLNQSESIIADDIRFEMLSRDLIVHGAALARAPTLTSFVKAEVERVRESAEDVRKLRKGRLVLVRFR